MGRFEGKVAFVTGVDTAMIHNHHTYEVFLPGREPASVTKAGVTPVFQGLNLLPVPWVEPQDVTNAVLFLASEEARFLIGVRLPVDAGFTMP
jgi:(+)-trans-carveol dehydrogenase